MSFAAIAIGTAAVGAGATIYGASQSKKAQESANRTNLQNVADTNAANKAIADDANKLNYQKWLESQGVGPDGKPVNTWLPRYFTTQQPFGKPAVSRFRRIGGGPVSAGKPLPTLKIPPIAPQSPGIAGFGTI